LGGGDLDRPRGGGGASRACDLDWYLGGGDLDWYLGGGGDGDSHWRADDDRPRLRGDRPRLRDDRSDGDRRRLCECRADGDRRRLCECRADGDRRRLCGRRADGDRPHLRGDRLRLFTCFSRSVYSSRALYIACLRSRSTKIEPLLDSAAASYASVASKRGAIFARVASDLLDASPTRF
jgi:hypothetical protein